MWQRSEQPAALPIAIKDLRAPCSADLLVGCTGGVLAARAKARPSVLFVNIVTERAGSGVDREAHPTAGQEAGATNMLTYLVRNAD